MSEMIHLTVTTKTGDTREMTLSARSLASQLVELHGGGWSESDTAKAMADQSAILSGRETAVRGLTIKRNFPEEVTNES